MTEIITWANGYGVWHARVPDTADSRRVAKRAIMAELRQRENNVSTSRVHLHCVDSDGVTVTYAEDV